MTDIGFAGIPPELLLSTDELELLPDDLLAEYLELIQVCAAVDGTWRLQARQQTAEDLCDKLMAKGEVFELLYGGAAAGGKSEWLLFHMHRMALKFPGFSGLLMRRSFRELERTAIMRSLARFDRRYCRYQSTNKRWVFDNGSTIEFGYCLHPATDVLMADGTYCPMRDVQVGDLVATLEGPRPVTAHWRVGVKPAVEMTVPGAPPVVASANHRVLAASGAWRRPTRGIGGSASVRRIPGWQPQQPPFAHLGLHGPEHDRARSAVRARGDVPSASSPEGSTAGCPTGIRSDDGRVRLAAVVARARIPSRGDAGTRTRPTSPPDGRARIRARSPLGAVSYSHPYTMAARPLVVDVHPASVAIAPAGDQELWDMTVAGANHYVTRGGIVHQNCDSDTDVYQYDSAEYDCVVPETKILMGDGTRRRIDEIAVGDLVQTLEGPRAVERVGPVGVKATVLVETPNGSVQCSLRHRLLAADGSWASPGQLLAKSLQQAGPTRVASPPRNQADRRRDGSRSPGLRRVNAPVQRVLAGVAPQGYDAAGSDRGTDDGASCDRPQDGGLPGEWYARLMLLGPDLRSMDMVGIGASCVPDGDPPGSGFRGSRAGCPSQSRSCGEGSHGVRAIVPACIPRPAGVDGRTRSGLPPGDRARTPARTPEGCTYAHPYTMEHRPLPAGAHPVWARIFPAGDRVLWDMQVAGENHYVSSQGIVHANCVGWDELTQFPTDYPYTYLFSRLRTSLAKSIRGLTPHVIAGTNPHRTGVAWVKPRWVDNSVPEEIQYVDVKLDENTSRRIARVFVPAKISDNRHVDRLSYLSSLSMLPDAIRKALEDGSWDVIEGQYFPEWNREVHVIAPFRIPDTWRKIGGLDFGIAAPFAHEWAAFDPDGVMYVYREAYARGLSPQQQVLKIKGMETQGERLDYRVADPSIWMRTGAGPPIAQQYADVGMPCRKANNARVDGWARLRDYLRPSRPLERPETGERYYAPMMYVFSTCHDLIRTLPLLVHDAKKPEDCDTDGEDHAPDALRYLTMSRPLRSRNPNAAEQVPRGSHEALRGAEAALEHRGLVNHPVLGTIKR